MPDPDLLSLRDAAPHIAQAMSEMVRQYKGASPALKKYYHVSLKWMARELEQFAMPRVSVAAQVLANETALGDLRRYQWRDQPTKMKDPQRKTFHWEHVLPVSDIVKRLVELPDPTPEAIASVLTDAQVAWITKEENKRLPRSGRANPLECYKQARIELLPP
jgi:hypothetical protein